LDQDTDLRGVTIAEEQGPAGKKLSPVLDPQKGWGSKTGEKPYEVCINRIEAFGGGMMIKNPIKGLRAELEKTTYDAGCPGRQLWV